MTRHSLPDSTLIDRVGSKIVVEHFGLSPQSLYNWRTRGIPIVKRIEFARLCAGQGVTPPENFFEKFELERAA